MIDPCNVILDILSYSSVSQHSHYNVVPQSQPNNDDNEMDNNNNTPNALSSSKRHDACTQTNDNEFTKTNNINETGGGRGGPTRVVLHQTTPIASPSLMILFFLNSAIHFVVFASYVRSTPDVLPDAEYTVGMYFFFSTIGLITLPCIACFPLLATVFRNPRRSSDARYLRFYASGIVGVTSSFPLLVLDIVMYVHRGSFGGSAAQIVSFVSSVVAGLLVPWWLYLDLCVDKIHDVGLKWNPL
eukprot:PhF_6_TR8846/c0_g1_i2/m.14016